MNVTEIKRKRSTKNQKYLNERRDILYKLYEILGVDDVYRMIDVDELEKNVNKQNQIIELVPDIKKYFSCGDWIYFSSKVVKKPYLSLAKSIIKTCGNKINVVYEILPERKYRKKLKIL